MYVKNRDTLDVWFDSGVTHRTVMRGSHPEQHEFPADLYLEGSDQHRGWFQSSLLTGFDAMDGRAPVQGVADARFRGRRRGQENVQVGKGNVIAPQQEMSDKLGAEILRLWTASTDYSGELSISE